MSTWTRCARPATEVWGCLAMLVLRVLHCTCPSELTACPSANPKPFSAFLDSSCCTGPLCAKCRDGYGLMPGYTCVRCRTFVVQVRTAATCWSEPVMNQSLHLPHELAQVDASFHPVHALLEWHDVVAAGKCLLTFLPATLCRSPCTSWPCCCPSS